MNHCTKEQLIAFEDRIKALWEAGELPYLVHLCGGNEDQLIEIFREVNPGDWVFSGHRSHYHALLSGMLPDVLEHKIKQGDSMFIFGPCGATQVVGDKIETMPVNFLTSSVLAGTCCIAVGVAKALKDAVGVQIPGNAVDGTGEPLAPCRTSHVWCFLGDGAEEQGHFYEAVMFACGHDLPITFVIEDNGRSVDTTVQQRRGNYWTNGLLDWLPNVRRYHYCPTYPHAGSGCKHHIVFKQKPV